MSVLTSLFCLPVFQIVSAWFLLQRTEWTEISLLLCYFCSRISLAYLGGTKAVEVPKSFSTLLQIFARSFSGISLFL